MNPAEILFAAQTKRVNRLDDEDDGCKGCLFEHERSTVCHQAGAEAKRRGIEDCEAGFVYVRVQIDPRQLDIFGEAACPA